MKKLVTVILFLLSLLGVFSIHSTALESKMPVIITTAGQGAGYFTIMENMTRAAIIEEYRFPFDFSKIVNNKQLEEGVGIPSIPRFGPSDAPQYYFNSYSTAPIGTPYKTIIFSIEYTAGFDYHIYELDTHPESATITSGKILYEWIYDDFIDRMRDIEYEYERIKENILWAKNNDVYIIGLYFSAGNDINLSKTYDKLFDIVIPACDVIIIHKNALLSDMVREKFKTMDNETILYELENSRYLASLLQEIIGY